MLALSVLCRRGYSTYFEKCVNVVSLMGTIQIEPRFAETRIFDENAEQPAKVLVFSLLTRSKVGLVEAGSSFQELHRVCVLNHGLQELIRDESFSIGDQVYVTGSLQYNRAATHGRLRNVSTIVAKSVKLIQKEQDSKENEYYG